MCTRYVFTDPAEAIRDLFRITAPLPNWPPNYNVAPTHSGLSDQQLTDLFSGFMQLPQRTARGRNAGRVIV